MKRLICLLFLALLPCLAAAEEPSLSITEVAAMTPEYYEGTCKLNGKRTIEFRAPVFVPDVEKMPVVRVRHQMLDSEEAKDFENLDSFECDVNYQKLSMFEELIRMGEEGGKSKSIGLESTYNLWSNNAQANMHQIYAENQTFSLGDVVDGLEEFIEEYYDTGFMPIYGRTWSAKYKRSKNGEMTDQLIEYKNLTGLGRYEIEGWQCIDGTPILGSIASVQKDQGVAGRDSQLRSKMRTRSGYVKVNEVFSQSIYSLRFYQMVEKTGLLYDDVPLCSFDVIQNRLQKMVDREELRYVYAIELGYALYCDPETEYPEDRDRLYSQECEYLLIPIWQVEVSQKRSKTGRTLESFNGPEGGQVDSKYLEKGEYNYLGQDPGYETLWFNAQTGELLNCECWDPRDTKMLYPKEIITWEEVQ